MTMRDVAHRWARWNEGDTSVRPKLRAGNISCFQNLYYSYRTVVAAYYPGIRGEIYALVSTNKWGISTGRHIKEAYWAVPSKRAKLVVPYVGNYPADIERNLTYLVADLQDFASDSMLKWASERFPYADGMWERKLAEKYQDVVDYVRVTGADMPDIESLEFMTSGIKAERLGRYNDYWRPSRVAKRERNRARYLATKVLSADNK